MSTSCLGLLLDALHFPSPQPGVSKLALLHAGEQTQVWFSNSSKWLSEGPTVRTGKHHGLETEKTWPIFSSQVKKSLGLLQAISLPDTLVKFGNIEKGVRNLSKQKSGQETCQQEQWSPVCSGSPGKCEWEVGLHSQSLWQCPLQQLSAGGVRSSF